MNKIILGLVTLLLVGCGQNDPGLAKQVGLSKNQLADIEARICSYDGNDCFLPIMALNVEGGMQVAVVDSLPGEAKYAAAQSDGYTSAKHQREVGVGYFDIITNALGASTAGLAGSTETEQF